MKSKKTILILLTLLSALLHSTVYASDLILQFGVYANDKPSALVKKFRPILNELEPLIGQSLNRNVSININVVASYQEGINGIVDGRFDFTRIGPVSYIKAKEKNQKS